MIKNLKNGVYINELGEESFLSESSVENRLKSFKPSDTTTTKKMFTLNHEDPKLTKRVTKISLPNAKIKKSKTNKSSFLAYSKRMKNESNSFNTNSIDIHIIPKIKLNKAYKPTKNSKVRCSYQTKCPYDFPKYDSNQSITAVKNHRILKRSRPNSNSKYSSCSFRNQNSLQPSKNFAMRRSSSAIDHESHNYMNSLRNHQENVHETVRTRSKRRENRINLNDLKRDMVIQASFRPEISKLKNNTSLDQPKIVQVESAKNKSIEAKFNGLGFLRNNNTQGQILNSDANSVRKQDNYIYNSRCYSSCENTGVRKELNSRNACKRQTALKKLNPTKFKSDYSDRLAHGGHAKNSSQIHTRSQNHSLY